MGNEGDIVRSTQVLHDLFCTLYSLIFDSLRKLGKKKALPTFRNGMEDSPTWMSHTFKKVLSLLGIPTSNLAAHDASREIDWQCPIIKLFCFFEGKNHEKYKELLKARNGKGFILELDLDYKYAR